MVENEFMRLSPPMVELVFDYFFELVSSHLDGNSDANKAEMALQELKLAFENNLESRVGQVPDDNEIIYLILNELRISFWFVLFSSLEGELRLDQLYRKSFPETESAYDQYLTNYFNEDCGYDPSQFLRLPIDNLLKRIAKDLSLSTASKLKGYVPIRDWVAHGRYFEPVSSPDNSEGQLSLNIERALKAVKEFSDEWGINEVLYEPVMRSS